MYLIILFSNYFVINSYWFNYFNRISKYNAVVDQLRAMAASNGVTKVLIPKKYSYSAGVSYAILNAVSNVKLILCLSFVTKKYHYITVLK